MTETDDKKTGKIIGIVVAVVVFIAVIILVVLIVNNNKKDDKSDDESDEQTANNQNEQTTNNQNNQTTNESGSNLNGSNTIVAPKSTQQSTEPQDEESDEESEETPVPTEVLAAPSTNPNITDASIKNLTSLTKFEAEYVSDGVIKADYPDDKRRQLGIRWSELKYPEMKADKTYNPSENGCITSEAEMEYYKNNLDVLAHLMMADFHYTNYGIYEGRFWPSKTIPTISQVNDRYSLEKFHSPKKNGYEDCAIYYWRNPDVLTARAPAIQHFFEHGEFEYEKGKKNGDTYWPGHRNNGVDYIVQLQQIGMTKQEPELYKKLGIVHSPTQNPILAGIIWLMARLANNDLLNWGGSSEGQQATYGEWLTKDNWTTVQVVDGVEFPSYRSHEGPWRYWDLVRQIFDKKKKKEVWPGTGECSDEKMKKIFNIESYTTPRQRRFKRREQRAEQFRLAPLTLSSFLKQ